MHLFGRVREPDEMAGIWRALHLTRASDEMVHKMGQDGGLVSAMLIWLREHDYIDAALVSGVEADDAWKAKPAVVTTSDEILATAGSRYTYCANPLALPRGAGGRATSASRSWGWAARRRRRRRCGTARPARSRKPFLFNIGLLCSKTFDDAIFTELFEAKYGLKKQDMVKMNIKGVFQIWMKRRLVPRDRPQGMPRLDPRRAARAAPTSRPSTPTSPPAASARTTTGRSRSCAPSSVRK